VLNLVTIVAGVEIVIATGVAAGPTVAGGIKAADGAVLEGSIQIAGKHPWTVPLVTLGTTIATGINGNPSAPGGTSGAGTAAMEGATYRIINGVRRSKAADIAFGKGIGDGTVPAEILGQPGQVIRVPVSALRSPKPVIDARTPVDLQRWLQDTLYPTLGGSEPPPILITPGSAGTPIPQVTIHF
jgi:hypothetical protein